MINERSIFSHTAVLLSIVLALFSCVQSEKNFTKIKSKNGYFVFDDHIGYKFVSENECSFLINNYEKLNDVVRENIDISVVEKKNFYVKYIPKGNCDDNDRSIYVVKIIHFK